MKYQEKPVDALEWRGTGVAVLRSFLGGRYLVRRVARDGTATISEPDSGCTFHLPPGHYVLLPRRGGVRIVSPDEALQGYDRVEE